MKALIFLFTAFIVFGSFAGCGSRTTEEAREAADEATSEMEVTHEEPAPMSAAEYASKALKAFQDQDLDKVKELVQPTLAYYVDEEYVEDRSRHVEGWDGEIRGVKYKKDTRTGLPLAVVYYADKDEDNILVHILDWMGDEWHAMGGAWGFEEKTREEFESYADNMEDLD